MKKLRETNNDASSLRGQYLTVSLPLKVHSRLVEFAQNNDISKSEAARMLIHRAFFGDPLEDLRAGS